MEKLNFEKIDVFYLFYYYKIINKNSVKFIKILFCEIYHLIS